MAGNAQLLGLGDLTAQLKKLRDDMRLKTSRRMVAAAGGVLRKEARAIAQGHGLKKSGALIYAILRSSVNAMRRRERNNTTLVCVMAAIWVMVRRL